MYTNANEMATLVADRMISIVDANRKSFVETDDFESVFENCFDMIIAPKTPKWAYDKVYEAVIKTNEIALALTVIKEMVAEERQNATEAIIFSQSPMKYYGLKQSDFI